MNMGGIYIDCIAAEYEYFFGTVVEDIAFGTERLPLVGERFSHVNPTGSSILLRNPKILKG